MEACHVLTISYSFRLGLYGVLHVFFRRSQILLTFSRNQVIYSAFSILLLAEGTCKGHSSYNNKAKNPMKDYIPGSLPALLWTYASFLSLQP